MIGIWIKGTVTARWQYLALSAAGIVAATALIGVIGAFGISSASTMTDRALSAVPLDWQVALAAGADAKDLTARLGQAAPIRAARLVGYADATAMSATIDGTTQTTGAGQILGLPTDYAVTFPGQMRRESFNGRFRDECLNVHWFLSLPDAQEKIEHGRQEYNCFRPHSSLQNLTPDEVVAATSKAELQNA